MPFTPPGGTPRDENGGFGGSVGADLRAANSSKHEVAAQERCSHFDIFMIHSATARGMKGFYENAVLVATPTAYSAASVGL